MIAMCVWCVCFQCAMPRSRHMFVCFHHIFVILVSSCIEFLRFLHCGAGVGEQEQRSDQHVVDLPQHFQKMLRIMAEELKKRFLKPDEHTMLSLFMNPSFDTSSETGVLFGGKRALCEIMTGFYTSR
jgi:hypothetical protein